MHGREHPNASGTSVPPPSPSVALLLAFMKSGNPAAIEPAELLLLRHGGPASSSASPSPGRVGRNPESSGDPRGSHDGSEGERDPQGVVEDGFLAASPAEVPDPARPAEAVADRVGGAAVVPADAEETGRTVASGATSGRGGSGDVSGDDPGPGAASEDDDGGDDGAAAPEAEAYLDDGEDSARAKTEGDGAEGRDGKVGDGGSAAGDEAGDDPMVEGQGEVPAPPGAGDEFERVDLLAASEPEAPPDTGAGVEEDGAFIKAANSDAGDCEPAGAGEDEDDEDAATISAEEGAAGAADHGARGGAPGADNDGTSAVAGEEKAGIVDGDVGEGVAPAAVADGEKVAEAVAAVEISEEEASKPRRGQDGPPSPGDGAADTLVEDGAAVEGTAADTAGRQKSAEAGVVAGGVAEPEDTVVLTAAAAGAAADPGATASEALGLAARAGLLPTGDLRCAVVTSHATCRAYRDGRTFHVKVSADTPRYVWSPPSPPPPPISRGGSSARGSGREGGWGGRGAASGRAGSRVAPLRVSHITWDRSVYFSGALCERFRFFSRYASVPPNRDAAATRLLNRNCCNRWSFSL